MSNYAEVTREPKRRATCTRTKDRGSGGDVWKAPRDPTGYQVKLIIRVQRSLLREPHSYTGCRLRYGALFDRKPLALGEVRADAPCQSGHQQHNP